MEFMEVVRKDEYTACAYFIDGKRVSFEQYHHEESRISFYGTFDCLHTTHTKTTWQHRKSGRETR